MSTLRAWGDGTYGAGNYGGVAVDGEPSWVVNVPDGAGGWRDVTCDVRSLAVDCGRSSWVEAFKGGTLEVVLANPDGRYSTFPPTTSLWRQPSGYTTDVPIRAGSVLVGVVEWHFTGTTDAVFDSWPGTTDAIATVTATDGFKQLARHQGVARAVVGAGELTGARIARLADDAGFAGVRRLDAGRVAVQGTDLAGITVDLMRQIGETEWGWLYMAGDGALVFRQRDAADTDPRMTTVQYVFADTDAIAGACYGEAVVGADSERIVNVAQVTPPGHALSTFTDAASVAWFGPRTWTRTDLPFNLDVDAAGLAQLIVQTQASDERRIDAVVVDAANRPDNYAAAHGVRLLDRIRFVRTYPGGYQLDAELIVQGRRDTVTPTGDGAHLAAWQVTLSTASAASIATLGLWDLATWDDGQWGV